MHTLNIALQPTFFFFIFLKGKFFFHIRVNGRYYMRLSSYKQIFECFSQMFFFLVRNNVFSKKKKGRNKKIFFLREVSLGTKMRRLFRTTLVSVIEKINIADIFFSSLVCEVAHKQAFFNVNFRGAFLR